MNLPDRIFAIGGAGKAIAFEILDTEWVLRSVLRPRPHPESITVTIIDTAQGEQNSDKRRIRELRTKIQEIEKELRNPERGRTGDIEITYKMITNDIQLNSSIDLVGDETVPRIAAGNGLDEDDWWLKESHVNENLDFAKGVVRKRGLGKAIYYKAYAEDDKISSVVDLPEKGQVAIIGGLGGGTGSGILLDLAQHLQSKQRTAEITLFGILPNKTEGVKENSNAYAALSELEHLALEDESIFKDRILLPIDPTGFDGKTGDRIQTQQFLQELDQAFVYLIASYYNTEGLEDPFASSPAFAPFTIGIPQVLRYNVEAISSARDSVRDILNQKRDALDAEEQIYSEAERFLDKHCGANPDGDSSLRDLDHSDLIERFERIESLVELDLFDELEYESVNLFRGVFRDAEQESDDIVEKIDVIDGMLRAGATTGGDHSNYVDDIDELLAEIIERDLRLLVDRKDLLLRKQTIEVSQIRGSVEYLLISGDEAMNPGVQLNRIEAKTEDLKEQEERLSNNLVEAEEELEQRKQEVQESVEQEVDDWVRDVQAEFDQLVRLSDVDASREIDALETSLSQFRTEVVNAEEPEYVENVDPREVRSNLDDLEDSLQRIGIDVHEQRQAIDRSLSALKNARVAFLNVNQEEGTVEKILPWESSTEEQRQEAQKDYQYQKTQLDDDGILQIGPISTSFTAEVEFEGNELEQRIEEKERDLLDTIVQSLERRDVRQEYVRTLETKLDPSVSLGELRGVATDAFREKAADTDDIEERKEKIETELDEVQGELSLHEATTGLYESVSGLRSTFVDAMESYHERMSEYHDESERNVATQEEEYVYIKNVQPNDLFRATGSDSLAASDLLKAEDEVQSLISNLEEFSKNARNERYTGLRRRKLNKDGVRYDGLKVRVAALSPAIDQLDPNTFRFRDNFSGSFDLGSSAKQVESPYTSWREGIGGRWEIGMTAFIDGVFLDNLRPVVDAEGYYDGYMERLEELREDIVVHHSYGLEDGSLIRRENVLNMEDPEDVAFFLRDDDKSVVDAILSDHVSEIDTDQVQTMEREATESTE